MKKQLPIHHPRNISKTAWFYVERGGLHVIAEVRDASGGYVATVGSKIRWRDVEQALRDHRKAHKPKPRRKARGKGK